MKFMMKVTFPIEAGNNAIKSGKMDEIIQEILEELKPEAAYFSTVNGCRGGYIFFDMNDSSKIPAVAEPWFLAFNAAVEIHPVMIPEDLDKSSGDIESAIKKYS